MDIADPIERAEAAGTAALRAMARLRIAPTPDNYLIWYTHFSGRDPLLSQALEALESAGEAFTPVRCSELYERFFGRTRTAQLIDQSCEQISQVMNRLLERVGGLKQDSGQYAVELEDFDRTLNETPAADELRLMVTSILSATQSMRQRVRALEDECAEASDNITGLQAQLSHARQEANTDALTQIANRRHLDQQLKEAVAAAADGSEPLSLLLMDIDHFKAFNDNYGHQVGDRVLTLIGQILTKNLKGRDLPARYGGEEFAALLPKTRLEGAIQIAEQIRSSVAASHFRLKQSGRSLGQITLSIGCAEYVLGEPLSSLIERVDRALYRAKREGRNRVCAADAEAGREAAA